MASNAVEIFLKLIGSRQFETQAADSAKSIDKIDDAAKRADTNVGKLGTTAKTAGSQTATAGKQTSGAMDKASGAVRNAVAAAGGLYLVGTVFKDAVGGAVSLEEATNKTKVVFGGASDSVLRFSETTTDAFGVSKVQALESAGTFGNLITGMGIGEQKAATMSNKMVGLAGDMASFNNASPEETLEALRSGLTGETEPLKRFGVQLSQARIEQYALRQGLWDGKGALTESQKAQAIYGSTLEQTKKQQGDFSRTSDSLANRQKKLQAQYANITAQLGEKLIPVLTWMMDHMPLIAAGVGLLTAAFLVYKAVALVATIQQMSLNLAFLASPITWIIIGIVALVAGLILAYKKSETFRNIVNAIWDALKKVAGVIWGALKKAFEWLKGILPEIWAIIRNHPLIFLIRNFGKIKTAATEVFNWVKDKFTAMIDFIRGLPGKVANAAKGLFNGIKDAFKSGINWVIEAWNDISLTLELPGLLKKLPGPDSVTIGTPNIPTFAMGGVSSGGAALVGERGPELVAPAEWCARGAADAADAADGHDGRR